MSIRTLGALLFLGAALAAQMPSDVIYFSSRFTETPASGRGGDLTGAAATCVPAPIFGGGIVIEGVVTNSPGMAYVLPGVGNTYLPSITPLTLVTDFVEIANFPQINLIIGDLDGDGIPNETSNFSGIDALYSPIVATGRANNIHEMFISPFSDSVGVGGAIGVNITEADLVLLRSASNAYPNPSIGPYTPIFFIRQADWEVLFGLAPGTGNGIDLNAFAVDEITGDLYASFDANIAGAQLITTAGGSAAPTTILPGDVVRIPGAAYTPAGIYGIVTAPVPALAELVLASTEIAAIVAVAGGTIAPGTATNVYGLDMDPQVSAGVSVSAGGFSYPDLIFTVNNAGGATTGPQNLSASAIYSTLGGGTFAFINNVFMDRPAAAGIRDVSFNTGFFAGPLDALEVIHHPVGFDPIFERPLHMDSFPDSGYGSAVAQRIVGYLSGSTPGAILGIFGRVDFVAANGFVPRYKLGGSVGGFPDLYVDPIGLADAGCVIAPTIFAPFCQFAPVQAIFNNDPLSGVSINPVTTYIDPVNGSDNGDSCFEINVPAFPASLPTLVLTFQCIDLSNLRLSDPLSFAFN